MGNNREDYPCEYNYLSLLNELEKLKSEGFEGFYGLEQQRVELHKAIFTSKNLLYDIDIEDSDVYLRSKKILTNLNVACFFNPPEHIGISACELHRLISCQEGEAFLTGKINRLRTKFGVIE